MQSRYWECYQMWKRLIMIQKVMLWTVSVMSVEIIQSGESIYTEDENSTNGDSSDDMDENRSEPSARRATRGRGLRSRGAGRGRAVTGARRGRGSGRMRGIALSDHGNRR